MSYPKFLDLAFRALAVALATAVSIVTLTEYVDAQVPGRVQTLAPIQGPTAPIQAPARAPIAITTEKLTFTGTGIELASRDDLMAARNAAALGPIQVLRTDTLTFTGTGIEMASRDDLMAARNAAALGPIQVLRTDTLTFTGTGIEMTPRVGR